MKIPAQVYYCQAHGLVIQPHNIDPELDPLQVPPRCVVGLIGALPCDLILLRVTAAERVTEPGEVTDD